MTERMFGNGKKDPERLSRKAFLERGLAIGGVAVGASLLAACGGSSSGGGGTTTAGTGADTALAPPTEAETAAPEGNTYGGVSDTNVYVGQEPQQGGVLRYAQPGGSPLDTMDPARGTPSATTFICSYALYDRLWKTTPDTYQIEPMLVDEFEASPDNTVWTIRLKDGIQFHNGKPLGPDDVIASIMRMLDPELASGRAGQLNSIDLNQTKKIDPLTLRIVLKYGQITLPESLAQFVHILPVDFDPEHPIGTGPFKFESFVAGQEGVFNANENYWATGPYLDQLVITNFASPTAVANALLSGQLQAGPIPYELTQAVQGKEGVNLQSFPVNGFAPIRMRLDAAPLDDVRVRQALRIAADRQAIIDQAYLGQAKLGNDLYAPQDPDYASDLPLRAYDPEQAKALLKEAGHDSIDLELFTTELLPGMTAAASVYAQQAKPAGINVKVTKLDAPAFFGPAYPDYLFCSEYRSTANYLLSTALNDGPTSTSNLTRFADPEFETLFFEAIGESDNAVRRPKLQRMQEIQYESGGYLIPNFGNFLWGYRNVGGIIPDIGALPLRWEELWLAS